MVDVDPVEDGLVEEPLLLVVVAAVGALGFEKGEVEIDQTSVIGSSPPSLSRPVRWRRWRSMSLSLALILVWAVSHRRPARADCLS